MRAQNSHAQEDSDRPIHRAAYLQTVARCACLLLVFLCGASFPRMAVAAPAGKTTVLMIEWRGETAAEKGFKEELRKAAPQVAFVNFDARQDKERLLRFLRDELAGKPRAYDYVYSFGTTASEMVRRVLATMSGHRIVHVINVVADPVAAKLADSLEAAGENRIVSCHLVPLEVQLRNARKIVKFARLAIIFNPREENANIQLQQLTDLSTTMGFAVIPIRIRPETEDLENALRQLTEREVHADCVYLHSESFLVSKARMVVKHLNESRIPTIAAVEPFMQEGALAGTITSYRKLGQLVAKAVAKDLKSPHTAFIGPVIFDPTPEFMLNTTTAGSLGIRLEGLDLAGIKPIK